MTYLDPKLIAVPRVPHPLRRSRACMDLSVVRPIVDSAPSKLDLLLGRAVYDRDIKNRVDGRVL